MEEKIQMPHWNGGSQILVSQLLISLKKYFLTRTRFFVFWGIISLIGTAFLAMLDIKKDLDEGLVGPLWQKCF